MSAPVNSRRVLLTSLPLGTSYGGSDQVFVYPSTGSGGDSVPTPVITGGEVYFPPYPHGSENGYYWQARYNTGQVVGVEISFRTDDSFPQLVMRGGAAVRDITLIAEFGRSGITWLGAYSGTSGTPIPSIPNGPVDIPVDTTRWFRLKVLPTGEVRLSYDDGARETILSGKVDPPQAVPGMETFESQVYANTNWGGTYLPDQYGDGSVSPLWVRDVALWVATPADVGRLKVLVTQGTGLQTAIDFEDGAVGDQLPEISGLWAPGFTTAGYSRVRGTIEYSADAFEGSRSARLQEGGNRAILSIYFPATEVQEIGARVKIPPGSGNADTGHPADLNWASIWFRVGNRDMEILPHQFNAAQAPNWYNAFGSNTSMVAFDYAWGYGDPGTGQWAYTGPAATWLGQWLDFRMRSTGDWTVKLLDGTTIFSGHMYQPTSAVVGAGELGIEVSSLGDGPVFVDNVYVVRNDVWKYASPKPGENGGLGRMKVLISDNPVTWALLETPVIT